MLFAGASVFPCHEINLNIYWFCSLNLHFPEKPKWLFFVLGTGTLFICSLLSCCHLKKQRRVFTFHVFLIHALHVWIVRSSRTMTESREKAAHLHYGPFFIQRLACRQTLSVAISSSLGCLCARLLCAMLYGMWTIENSCIVERSSCGRHPASIQH